MTFELYKEKSDTSPPQRESFLSKFTSSFMAPKIPKTYCTYQYAHPRYPTLNPFFLQTFE